MSKITFIGDIMCEKPLLRASEKGRKYDFRPVFDGCRSFFEASDYVVGNLETIFAGEDRGYTNSLFSFNTPDEFAAAMAQSGIDMVTAATNHALDRDKAGLLRTLDLLDKLGTEHIGAYRSEEERKQIFVKDFNGRKAAFLNYTYGTNLNESPYVLDEKEYYLLNLLMPQKKVASKPQKGLKGKLSRILYKTVPLETILKLKKLLGRDCTNKYTDRLDASLLKDSFLDRIKEDMKEAKALADTVIVCLHIGGQFNETPGTQAEYFTEMFADLGADFLIDTHAHVVQDCRKVKNCFVANCLGNFSISPSSVYVPHELKPEYSAALHLYLEEKGTRAAFSILKITEEKNHMLRVLPVSNLADSLTEAEKALLEQDVTFIYNRFTGKNERLIPIREEYSLG